MHRFSQDIREGLGYTSAAQKTKFSIKGFFSKDDQIRSLLQIWSHLLKKSLKKNFIFCTVSAAINFSLQKPPHTRTLEDDSSENSGNF